VLENLLALQFREYDIQDIPRLKIALKTFPAETGFGLLFRECPKNIALK
jgi:hypothetical protein